MKKIFFTKMNGAGNDFILIDKGKNLDLKLTPYQIKLLCRRHFGIGADGLIIIEDDMNADFKITFFNNDGFEGSLCGNGSRCAIKYYACSKNINKSKINFVCKNSFYSGKVFKNGKVKFNMNEPKNFEEKILLKLSNYSIEASFIDTGSPHTIIEAKNITTVTDKNKLRKINLENIDVLNLGRLIRHNIYFGTKGTNVNFIEIENNKIKIRTFERGVENETLACGTGSAASAIVSAIKYNIKTPIIVITNQNKKLKVDFKIENNKIKNLTLTGNANIVYNGVIEI